MAREVEENEGTTEQMIIHEDPPVYKDRFFITYVLFYTLGTASLIPQHFFTTATDYWMYKFRDPILLNASDAQKRTGLQAEFFSYFAIVGHVTNLVFLGITIFFLKRFSTPKRIITALCGALLMFAVTCVFVMVNTDSWQRGFFFVSLSTGLVLTGCFGTFVPALFEMVAKFPPQYLATMLSGHSICGIFASLLQLFSLSIGASSTTTGLIYFLIGMFFVFFTLTWLLMSLRYSDFFRYHLGKTIERNGNTKFTKERFFTVFKKIKYYLISLGIVLGCTIMMHPGVASLAVSMGKGSGSKWNDVFFVPVTTFLLFFVCDYIGRELAAYLKRPRNGIIILIASCLRIGFAPLLMFCNIQPRSHLPVVFDEDYAYILLIIFFAFTNGYLINICVILVPMTTEADEKKLSMNLILLFMLVSMCACSFLSAVIVKAL